MDWEECIKKRIVKDVKEDKNMIKSARDIADIKIESADALPEHLFIGKITLLYDALRENLECLALENNFKVYNHECYTAFLKEILGRVLTYAETFSEKEMGVMLVSDLHRAIGQSLFAVPEFAPWASSVAEIMVYSPS